MVALSHDILLNGDKVRCRRIDIGLHSVLFDFANCHVEAVLASPLAALPGNESVVGIETVDGAGGTVVFRISERQRVAFRLRRLRPEEEWTERHNGCPRSSLFPFWDDKPSVKIEVPMKSDGGVGKKSIAVSDSRVALEAIHADIRQIKAATTPLPAAVAKVDRAVETVQKHVRGDCQERCMSGARDNNANDLSARGTNEVRQSSKSSKVAPRTEFDWVRQAELVRALERVLGEAESPDKATLTRAVQKGLIMSNGETGRKCLLQVDSVKAWLTKAKGMEHSETQQVADAIITEVRMRKR